MGYFVKRERIFAALDADKVDEASFKIEGPDHPCFVLAPHITLAGAEVMAMLKGDTPADHIHAMAAGAAVIVESLAGKWALYPGGGADWPEKWAGADMAERQHMASAFDVRSLARLAQAAQRKATLSETEQGE